MTPKSPLMVLNEMVGSVTYNFVDNPQVPMNPGMPHLFTAQCNVIKSNEMRVTLKIKFTGFFRLTENLLLALDLQSKLQRTFALSMLFRYIKNHRKETQFLSYPFFVSLI